MKNCHSLWLAIFLLPLDSQSQTNDSVVYTNALLFLETQYTKGEFENLKADCRTLGQHLTSNDVKQFNVSNKMIGNNSNYVICDLLKKRYRLKESCTSLLAFDNQKIEPILDSIANIIALHADKAFLPSKSFLARNASKNKRGMMVFFSPVYDKVVCLEVKAFCYPFDQGPWQGSSRMYMLVLSESGEIREYYVGEKTYQ